VEYSFYVILKGAAPCVERLKGETLSHSYLSDTIGSMLAARRAGSQEASKAVRITPNETEQKIIGSVGSTA
jgi:hypothetical protein